MKTLLALTACMLAIAGMSACAPPAQQSPSAAMLARDFARTGLVVGKPLPDGLRLERDSVLEWGEPAGSTGYMCANGGLTVDPSGNLEVASLWAPELMPDARRLSIINIETWQGTELFEQSEESVIQTYGEPNEKYIEDTNPPPVLWYMYHFRKDKKTLVSIGLGFPEQGERAGKLDYALIMLYGVDESGDTLSGDKKIHRWPKGL